MSFEVNDPLTDPEIWSPEEFVARSLAVLPEIRAVSAMNSKQPIVCFHFVPLDASHDDNWGEDAVYVPIARRLFEALPISLSVDYIGGHSGIEAWEEAFPDEAWVIERIPVMIQLAADAGMSFQGWSFEPRGGPFVTVGPGLRVMVGGSAEAEQYLADIMRQSNNSDPD